MTYCVGFLLDGGLVFASDSRTNAGVDYISTYSKMHVFQPADDRLFVLLAAGNLATTQSVLNRIQRDLEHNGGRTEEGGAAEPSGSETTSSKGGGRDLLSARYLFEAAEYVGRVSVAVQEQHRESLHQSGASAEASFILGGQIRGEAHGLYLVYSQGNAVMATADTPFLQIGESKYGKPPLDFVGHCGLSLEDAARLCLISLMITRRSNLTVGPPFELAMMPADELRISRRVKLDKGAPEISRSMEVWAGCMQDGLQRLPRFAWEEQPL
ncbi:20S proteasome subunit A/B [Synechococcus sp. RSCCF101]|uniref:20S proteasome subunit A/B n=1 Tax=Synechococcus sp. RSCCF101 TaxID=2511069 RepID=UPI001243CABC|nr:20S proteasome subunit A/B [Synechococcus sp. RSCCF101]QEY32863.1 20S proteasome subunit A/B [Synechococcus sp. RSCCF101]